ncbi:DUF2264 domain-containing protein [Paenibacillus sp. WQ 127069]|uniref:DUF2264 domain-containing protein n=1 Tax=Paenibacillus baimaensis TaxID=2982185 RepID=A0ABT2UK22_9BACL|nr:DUF2264 domain-containing protein [Paenibacillus sp. WQ 127069]MCU6794990.1 DUF2264 domain-containing protein [Paenibacillus sp. WQ 127069]
MNHLAETTNDRSYWVDTLCRVVTPVLEALAAGKLKQTMPIENNTGDRAQFTHLEALGRTLTGLAPWLESGSDSGHEGELRRHIAVLAREAIRSAVDPASADYLNFRQGFQPVVDAAFVAHAILRAPTELFDKLDDAVRHNLIAELTATRYCKPGFNNWLLFSAIVEAALFKMGAAWDSMRIDYALRQHEQWYKGDGAYGDGPEFHWDYYNSYVIQPMLIDIVETVGDCYPEWQQMRAPILLRAQRYAAVQERLISPEGTFPPIGRSLAYRTGAFQLLAQVALREELPGDIAPAQVRCALTAVIRRTLEAPGTYDVNGWLQIGLSGTQPGIGEYYISTGSLYLCSTVFITLGLPAHSSFWQGSADWTAKKIWSGAPTVVDQALRKS